MREHIEHFNSIRLNEMERLIDLSQDEKWLEVTTLKIKNENGKSKTKFNNQHAKGMISKRTCNKLTDKLHRIPKTMPA